jgi:hypothetical protein
MPLYRTVKHAFSRWQMDYLVSKRKTRKDGTLLDALV